jgi:TonB family protein
MRRLFRDVAMSAVTLAVLLVISSSARGDDLQHRLRTQYQGKTLVLRGFYTGDKLRYDATGALASSATPGDWTSDGFVVLDRFHESGTRLVVEVHRLLVTRLTPEFGFSAAKRKSADDRKTEPAVLKIEIDFGTIAPSAEQVAVAMSRIFLNEQDSLVDLVPEYWKPCVREGLAWKDENCRFSSQLLAIPGVSLSDNIPRIPATLGSGSQPASRSQAFRVGNGVSPPKAIYQPEPEFSESARAARYQGSATLGLIVSAEGKPTKILILRPLGAGLDAKAVQAVQTWKFKPAEKEGQPVRVEIAVEVSFHLY